MSTFVARKKIFDSLPRLVSHMQAKPWFAICKLKSSTSAKESTDQSHLNTSRFLTDNIKELPIATQEELYKADDKTGFIPNFYQAMAYRPHQFESLIQYRNAIVKREGSNLRREDFELVGLVAGSQHGCLYCVIAHSALYRVFSKNPNLADQVATNFRSADLSARQLAIASLAAAVARCHVIEDRHFSELAKHGLTMDDAWDIASMASFTTMTSGMINFLKVKPNPEYYAMGR